MRSGLVELQFRCWGQSTQYLGPITLLSPTKRRPPSAGTPAEWRQRCDRDGLAAATYLTGA